MRIVDPKTGCSCLEKCRRRFPELGQPRELTFSCFRHFRFLKRERTRFKLFREAATIECPHANPVRRGLVTKAEN